MRSAASNVSISLAAALAPPTFDLTRNCLKVPGDFALIQQLLAPWPAAWLDFRLEDFAFKEPTKRLLSAMPPWPELLQKTPPTVQPEVHLYLDGSWLERSGFGGYAVVAVVTMAGVQAILGMWGERTQGGDQGLWVEDYPPALYNEQIAFATSLMWVLQGLSYLSLHRVVLHYDCMAAGMAATGVWQHINHMGARSRALEQMLRELVPFELQAEHVKAHNGDPLNEMVDVLAKTVATDPAAVSGPPRAACEAFLRADLSWAATRIRSAITGELPITKDGYLCWGPADMEATSHIRPEQLIPTTGEGHCGMEESMPFALKAFSFNVQSLKGHHRYIEAQLEELGCNIAFFQEAKGRAGACESRRYLRLATDGASHWGVEVWISKLRGLCTLNDRPQMVRDEDIRVVMESPRLLILSIELQGRKFVVVSGHCPHAARDMEACRFMEELLAHLRPLAGAALIIVGLDLNGRVPADIKGVTGGLSLGQPDANGNRLVHLAQACNLWLPSTFPQLHRGTMVTYRQANGAEHRIDYLALGGHAVVTELCSWTAQNFDSGSANDDHDPVVLDFEGVLGTARSKPRLWRPKYDLSKLLSAEGKTTAAAAMREYRPPPWSMHPTDHYQHFLNYVHEMLRRDFTPDPAAARADFIQPETWALRDAKMALKRRVRHRAGFWRAMMPRAFLQWATGQPYGVEEMVASQGLLYEVMAAAVKTATARIRTKLRRDKAAYLTGLATSDGLAFQDVVAAAKKAGIGGRSARAPWRSLPALRDSRGVLAETWEDRDRIWMAHFGDQEFGVPTPTQQLIQDDCKDLQVDVELHWAVEDVPSMLELESACRAAPRRKAIGLDGIPGEFLAAAAPEVARSLFALTAKAALVLKQPLHWRGGILQEAWKRTGARDSACSYRSLFVSSVVGKGFHRLLRARTHPTTTRPCTTSTWGRGPRPRSFSRQCMCRTFCGGKSSGGTVLRLCSWTHRVPTTG